ncbi:MAG: A/G-specific adenine glycosylase [Nitrospinales bacterium]
MASSKTFKSIQQSILNWYQSQKRDLPWRKTRDPYFIWVSEIMLQQTQVRKVIPYYERWISAFPTIDKLAQSLESKVLKLWEGLGYYSRARNLHKAAKIIALEHGGKVPDTYDKILRLPGIGHYSAGAILSIAYSKHETVLDGNVIRVLARLFKLNENGSNVKSLFNLRHYAVKLLSEDSPGDFNQAMMELGSEICSPRKPACTLCPAQSWCMSYKNGEQEDYPPHKVRQSAKKIEVSAAVILKSGKVYIQQRPNKGLMGGLWEFPGGKLEKNESQENCLLREINEELGVDIKIQEKLMTIKHSYTKFRVTLHVFNCRLPSGRINATCCEQWKWVKLKDLANFPFPAANVKIVDYLVNNKI